MKFAGAGRNRREAEAPAILKSHAGGRLLVFSYGSETSGIDESWAATSSRPGVNLLKDFSERTLNDIKTKVGQVKREEDISVLSVHWGSNWGYDIPSSFMDFAHKLIDYAGVDIVHGHSSHHAKAIEIYEGKPIFFGCGDFLNDYEGIGGYEEFRGDLALMYFVEISTTSKSLISLKMKPMQIRNFRLNRASKADAAWLKDVLNREGRRFGTRVELEEDNTLVWKG